MREGTEQRGRFHPVASEETHDVSEPVGHFGKPLYSVYLPIYAPVGLRA
jgi:hypothetical protein